MTTIFSSEQAIKQKWDRIITMARNNGFPVHLIHRLRKKSQRKKTTPHLYREKSTKIANGLPSHITALPYIRSLTFSDERT
jgi:hypothetical protein